MVPAGPKALAFWREREEGGRLSRAALYQGAFIDDAEAAAGGEPQCGRVELMLGGLDAGFDLLWCVTGQDGDGGLGDDGAGVHIKADKMDSAAGDFGICFQRALMGVQALESGEQGGVDVELAVVPMLDKFAGQQPHETGIADQLYLVGLKAGIQGSVKLIAAFKLLMVDDLCFDAFCFGDLKAACFRAV